MIRVTIDPELARARYGMLGELLARGAGHALERTMGAAEAQGAPLTKQKAVSDLVLGVVIAGAIGALAWWNHAEGKKRRR